MLTRLKAAFLITLATVLVSGCVTEVTQLKESKINFEKAVESHVQLGLGYLRQNNRESARRHFNKALELDSSHAGALAGLALVYQVEGENKLADKYYRKAIKKDSDYSQARYNYGAFLYAQGEYKKAYKQFSTLSKDYNYVGRPLVIENLARCAIRLNRIEEAEKLLEQALGLNPNLGKALIELAELKFDTEQYASSKKLFDRYVSLNRHSPRSLWLGIRLEKIFGNKDNEASFALALKNLHPYSKEYLEYKKSLADKAGGK